MLNLAWLEVEVAKAQMALGRYEHETFWSLRIFFRLGDTRQQRTPTTPIQPRDCCFALVEKRRSYDQ
jgi:hypothetical protein